MKVIIGQACDGFEIQILDDSDYTQKIFRFDQEESVIGLVDVFEHFGIEAEFEEVY